MSIWEEYKNSFRRPGNMVIKLMLVNLTIFVLGNIMLLVFGDSGNMIYNKLFTIPGNLRSFVFQPWSLVTYGFAQLEFMHFLMNMIFLYFFGDIVSKLVGPDRVLPVYILGVLAGGISFLLVFSIAGQMGYATGVMLGSSAAVFSLAVVAALQAPNLEARFLIFPIKLKFIVIVFILLSFTRLRQGMNVGGELAHLAGAFAGYYYFNQLKKGKDIGAFVNNFINWAQELFKPKPKIKVSHKREGAFKSAKKSESASTYASSEKVDQEEIDAILDKISQSGYESLSKEEKRKLFSASQKK